MSNNHTADNSLPLLERTEAAPSELETDGDNPNTMGERQFAALKENIREFGFIVPVIIDTNNVIADGEHRLRAAEALELDTIPVVRLDIDDPDRRVLRQVMNKLKGDHDIHEDAHEFEKILATGRKKADFAELLGQSEKSIDGVLEMIESNSSTGDTFDDVASSEEGTPSSGPSVTNSDDDLGSPDALDPDTMEFEHECPQCGYEWD